MPEISQATQKLIQKYLNWHQSVQRKEAGSTIQVDETASRVAGFYEKIRGVIEWKEEHLLKKAAIERMIKRRLLLIKDGKLSAEALIQELIRGGHFPNNHIEKIKIEVVQRSLDKYIFVFENSSPLPKEKIKNEFTEWFLKIAACEIEEILSPPLREKALIEYMTELMKEKIRINSDGITESEISAQIYIAVQRALFKFDNPLIAYNLLKKWYPNWKELSENELKEITKNIYSIWQNIEKNLNHRFAERFYNVCEKYDTPYLILGDILTQDPYKAQDILRKPELMESAVKQAYQKRLRNLKEKIRRAAIFTTISIFITKMILALALEVQFDKYILHRFDYANIGLNILIPPLLMLVLVLTIRMPEKGNLELVLIEVGKIVFERERKELCEIESLKKRGVILHAIIFILYLLSFIISFGAIVWMLQQLQFSILSMAIFLAFFCLIAFAGVKIRERSRELEIGEKKENSLQVFFDLFTVPIIRTGKWLSNQLIKYNFVVILITVLIDLPFQFFVEFLEQWRYFLREKKEDIH